MNAADEFFPEYQEAIGEPLEALIDAIDAYGRAADARPTSGLPPPDYSAD